MFQNWPNRKNTPFHTSLSLIFLVSPCPSNNIPALRNVPHLSQYHRVWHWHRSSLVIMSQGVTLCDSDTDPHNGPTGCFTQQWSSHGKSHACPPPPPVLLQPLAIRQSLNARVARFCKGQGDNICFGTDQNFQTWRRSWSKIIHSNYPIANWLFGETNWDAMAH